LLKLPKHVGEKGLQQTAAITVHRLLYAALIIQPFLGWYATNAWGVKNIPFFFVNGAISFLNTTII